MPSIIDIIRLISSRRVTSAEVGVEHRGLVIKRDPMYLVSPIHIVIRRATKKVSFFSLFQVSAPLISI